MCIRDSYKTKKVRNQSADWTKEVGKERKKTAERCFETQYNALELNDWKRKESNAQNELLYTQTAQCIRIQIHYTIDKMENQIINDGALSIASTERVALRGTRL